MREAFLVRRSSVFILAVLVVAGSARQAHAQGFISPFLGYNFGGDAGCPEITDCKDKNANYGVSFGALGAVVGYEAEFAYTSDFFGESPTGKTNVLTFMNNFMLAPKFGPIQPYGLAGVGLIRTSVDTAGVSSDENQFGYDIGGGLIGFFSDHVGIRGDIRYFHSFQVLDLSRLPGFPLSERKLDYGRISGALVFKF
jgi:opacity protein-like surface antigen